MDNIHDYITDPINNEEKDLLVEKLKQQLLSKSDNIAISNRAAQYCLYGLINLHILTEKESLKIQKIFEDCDKL